MPLLTDLNAYWKLDESSGNAVDSSGNSRTLTNVGTTGFAAALINNGVNLGSSNSTKSLTSSIDLGIGSGNVSVSAWIKPTAYPSSNSDPTHSGRFNVFMVQDAATGVAYQLHISNVSGTITCIFSRWRNSVLIALATVSFTPPTTSYTHLVGTFDGSTLRLYVNNGTPGTTSTSGTGSGGGDLTSIGSNGASQSYFSGIIDEVGVWSRELSSLEVAELYNSGAGLSYPFSPPSEPLTLDTQEPDSITSSSAQLNGEITDVGVDNAVARGFVYDTSSHSDPGDTDPDDSDYAFFTTESGDFGTGVFDDSVTSLSSDTTYYVRAWAENSDGFAYGDEITFDTLEVDYKISGTVTLSGSPVSGAVVRCIRQSDNVALAAETTDGSGNYEFLGLDISELYHLSVEFESGETLYNAPSLWDIVPVLVE